MNLRWITLFATIAEEGSFTRAATKLNIAQPWLSAQLRKLEYELGIQLLVRESIGVKVTEAGERLLPHARQMAESARMFREIARSLDESKSKLVMLGSHRPLIDMPQMKALTIEFTSRYADYELYLSNGNPAELLKALEESSIDLAILPASCLEDRPELRVQRLYSAHVCLLSPQDHPIDSLSDSAVKTVELPPRDWDEALFSELSTRLRQAGVAAREISEFDRRAVIHAVNTRGIVAAMVLDDQQIELNLDELGASAHIVRLDDMRVDYMLCRIADRHLGRASERFWSLCASAAASQQN